jgi:hypothetical protein
LFIYPHFCEQTIYYNIIVLQAKFTSYIFWFASCIFGFRPIPQINLCINFWFSFTNCFVYSFTNISNFPASRIAESWTRCGSESAPITCSDSPPISCKSSTNSAPSSTPSSLRPPNFHSTSICPKNHLLSPLSYSSPGSTHNFPKAPMNSNKSLSFCPPFHQSSVLAILFSCLQASALLLI